MATKETGKNAGSRFQPAAMDPDSFSTGRPDGFVGTILGTYAYPYKGKSSTDGKYYLNIGWVIQPDPDSGFDLFTESYSAGFLNQAVPSKDNKVPAGGSDEDYIALSNGKSDGLDTPAIDDSGMVIPKHDNVGEYVLGAISRGRSWEQAVRALIDSDTKKLADFSTPGYLGFANGLRCRFDRVPQEGAGKKKEGEKEYKVLVPTEVLGKGDVKASAGAGVTSASTSGAKTSANGSGDLSERIKTEVLAALGKAKDNKLKKGNLLAVVPKAFEKAEKGDVMAWLGEDDNLADIPGTMYDLASDERWLELEG